MTILEHGTETCIGGPTLPQIRRLVTEVPGPNSRALAKRRSAALPAGLTSGSSIYVAAAGGGVVVEASTTTRSSTSAAGIAVTTVGNSAPRVVERTTRQLGQFTHTCFLANPYEGYLEVCEALNRLTPGDHEKRTALFNTGSEALENAVKYARAATGRPAVVVFDHAFHGRTLMTMTMTAKNQPYKAHIRPVRTRGLPGFRWHTPNRWPERPRKRGRRSIRPVPSCDRHSDRRRIGSRCGRGTDSG